MKEKIIEFFSGVSRAYDLFGFFYNTDKNYITIESGFENVGKAFKNIINKNVKQDSDKQNKPSINKIKKMIWNL